MNKSLLSPQSPSSVADKTAGLAPGDAIFRELFEGAPIGMALLALDERFLRVNASFCRMVGYSNEELRQRHDPFRLTFGMTADLHHKLLAAVEHTVAMLPTLAQVLDQIVTGPTIGEGDLPSPVVSEREPPSVGSVAIQTSF